MATARRAVDTVGSMMYRAVHVEIYPRTRNIRESREILRTMKEYGDIISFRNKQYDIEHPGPNIIIAVFRERSAAERFVAASPLSVTISTPPPSGPVASPASFGILHGLGNLTKSLQGEGSSSEASANKDDGSESVEFLIKAELSTSEQARVFRRQPFYWGYELAHHPSYIREDLAKNVPIQGLCDIETRPELPNDKVLAAVEELRRIKTLRQMCNERDEQQAAQAQATP